MNMDLDRKSAGEDSAMLYLSNINHTQCYLTTCLANDSKATLLIYIHIYSNMASAQSLCKQRKAEDVPHRSVAKTLEEIGTHTSFCAQQVCRRCIAGL